MKTSNALIVAVTMCLLQTLFAACTPSVPPAKPLTPELQEQIKQEDLSIENDERSEAGLLKMPTTNNLAATATRFEPV